MSCPCGSGDGLTCPGPDGRPLCAPPAPKLYTAPAKGTDASRYLGDKHTVQLAAELARKASEHFAQCNDPAFVTPVRTGRAAAVQMYDPNAVLSLTASFMAIHFARGEDCMAKALKELEGQPR